MEVAALAGRPRRGRVALVLLRVGSEAFAAPPVALPKLSDRTWLHRFGQRVGVKRAADDRRRRLLCPIEQSPAVSPSPRSRNRRSRKRCAAGSTETRASGCRARLLERDLAAAVSARRRAPRGSWAGRPARCRGSDASPRTRTCVALLCGASAGSSAAARGARATASRELEPRVGQSTARHACERPGRSFGTTSSARRSQII